MSLRPMMQKFYIALLLTIAFISGTKASSTLDKLTAPVELTTGFDAPYAIASMNIEIKNTKIPLLIDTGFGANADMVLSGKLAKKLVLHYTGKSNCSLSQSGKDCFDEVIIPSVTIQNHKFHNLVGLVSHGEWGGAQYYKNFNKTIAYNNGIITLKFLKRFNIFFDYKKNLVLLYNINTEPAEIINHWHKIRFDVRNGNIVTSIKFNNHNLDLIWDTAYLPSQLKQTLFNKSKIKSCPNEVYNFFAFSKNIKCFYSKNRPGVNNLMPGAIFVIKDIGVPDFVPIDGFVGGDYVYSHRIFVDFKSNFIFVK